MTAVAVTAVAVAPYRCPFLPSLSMLLLLSMADIVTRTASAVQASETIRRSALLHVRFHRCEGFAFAMAAPSAVAMPVSGLGCDLS